MNLAALYPTMSSNPLRGSVLSMYKRLLRLSQTWQVGVSILYHLRFVHTRDVDLVSNRNSFQIATAGNSDNM
jgi:hypothetical protein